jgi:hypothetical protein
MRGGAPRKAYLLIAAPGAGDADGDHGRPPRGGGNEIGAMLGEVVAHPAPGLVQARPGRVLPCLGVGVIPQNDGAPLPGGKLRHRGAHGVRAVDIVRRRHPVSGGRVQRLRPIGQQRGLAATPRAAADVRGDARQPSGEPVRVPEPVQGDERPQERLLHDVVGVAWVGAQLSGPRADHGLVPLDKQPERHLVAVTRQQDQLTVTDVRHRRAAVPGSAAGPGRGRPGRRRT